MDYTPVSLEEKQKDYEIFWFETETGSPMYMAVHKSLIDKYERVF